MLIYPSLKLMEQTLLHEKQIQNKSCFLTLNVPDKFAKSLRRRERIPPLELGGGNGVPLVVGGTLVFPLEWHFTLSLLQNNPLTQGI